MIDPRAYTISVRRTEFEDEICFEARVKELPDLAEYADSAEEVYALAIDAIETTAAVFLEKGIAMPVPLATADDYSGRVTLRLPKSLHRALAQTADDEGVSLNQHLVNVLSYFSGFVAAPKYPEKITSWHQLKKPASQKVPGHGLTLVSSRNIPHEPKQWDKVG